MLDKVGCEEIRITPAHAGTTAGFLLPRTSAWGSPPLTRGQQAGQSLVDSEAGITPAHAGTTRLDVCDSFLQEDHPRSRGDNIKRRVQGRFLTGSPPLTRGQLVARYLLPLPLGITPAHAGTTDQDELTAEQYRITPAHAGTTVAKKEKLTNSGDHPRSRGDNRRPHILVRAQRGSPPLTRGQLKKKHIKMSVCRITPAHAGTTHHQCPKRDCGQDHPRSRGDNLTCSEYCCAGAGSPPLTRGQLTR